MASRIKATGPLFSVNVRRQITKELKGAVISALNLLKAEVKANSPVASGKFQKSIKSSIFVNQKSISGYVYADVVYAPYVEEGRGPGGIPPVTKILAWVRRKGIQPTEDFAYNQMVNAFRFSNFEETGILIPYDAMETYARTVGFVPSIEASERALAWAIAKKIGREGTPGAHVFEKVVSQKLITVKQVLGSRVTTSITNKLG